MVIIDTPISPKITNHILACSKISRASIRILIAMINITYFIFKNLRFTE